MNPGQKNEVCHIFDLAGNVFKWTTEKTVNGARTSDRGGGAEQSYANASSRDRGSPSNGATWLGYRVMLYIN